MAILVWGALPITVAAQAMPPVALDVIEAGMTSCLSATTPNGLDEVKVLADGWHNVSLSANGKPVATELRFYSRDGMILMLSKGGKMPLCSITASLADSAGYLKLQAAIAARYGGPIGSDPKGEYLFFTTDRRHLIDIAATGTVDHPAVRIAVGYVPQETK